MRRLELPTLQVTIAERQVNVGARQTQLTSPPASGPATLPTAWVGGRDARPGLDSLDA